MGSKENRELKQYIRCLTAGLLCLMLCGVLLSNYMVEKVLRYQKNIIGVLQERDETQIHSYLDAMFEDTDDAHVETGSEILRQYGYTGAGIYFMGQKMGIQERANAAILLFVVIVAGTKNIF